MRLEIVGSNTPFKAADLFQRQVRTCYNNHVVDVLDVAHPPAILNQHEAAFGRFSETSLSNS